MNRDDSNLLSFRRWASVLGGLLLLILGGFYFFNVSAQTETFEKTAEQNLALGKLAFIMGTYGPGPNRQLATSNPDGSGATTIPVTGNLFPNEPAWSPDGTRLVFGAASTGDIWVINADGSGQTNLTNTTNPTSEFNPSWSATGKIAYERSSPTVAQQIWVMNADGSRQAQFPGIAQPQPSDPAWSPDGTKLAFVSGGEIWVINADGTNELRLTTTASTDTDPAWSPDGSKMVFAKSGSGISVINADGTNETPLTGDTSDITPSWSPDGTKIAFRRGSGLTRGINTMDPNGANQVRILGDQILFPLCCDTLSEFPTWQPLAQTPNTYIIAGRVTYNNLPVSGVTINLNGTTNAAVTTDAVGNYQFSDLPTGGNYTVSPSFPRYYFTPPNRSFNNLASNQTGNNFEVLGICQGGRCVKNGKIAFTRSGEIFTINSDGTGEANITNNAATDNEPDYSPDGANIIFSTNRDGNYEIYRMNADGSSPVNLTNNDSTDINPFYSYDGKYIVFSSFRDGNYEIYKMNADGTNQVRLTNNPPTDYQPAFSPDGSKIIFVTLSSSQTTQTKVNIMNADGSNFQPFPAPGGIAPLYERLSYSPDGSKIMFTYTPDAQSQFRNSWTINADGTNAMTFPGGTFGSYSPDGTKVVYTCCLFDNTNRVRTSDALGSSGSVRVLTPSNTGNGLPDWQAIAAPRPAPFDFDGDGRSDQSIFRPSTGDWWYLSSRSSEQRAIHWGLSDDTLAPADYDGDLKTDVAVWRASDGNFYILNSFDNTVRIEHFGLSGDVPTGGDWDADGKTDLAVYRAGAQGVFYYRASMGNPNANITVIPWGISGDKPVAGDYDGDGRTDAAIYRSGVWWIRRSSDGQSSATSFGLADDHVVPADYDGDGKTDLAVYRGGVWYLLRSAQGSLTFQFGLSKDIPAPADYDGDGKTDAGVYRSGVWWILKTQSGTAEAISFGLSSDKPVPSAFVR